VSKDTTEFGRTRQSGGVVPGRMGCYTLSSFFICESKDSVTSPAELESACPLEVLAFQPKLYPII
jgi:hypothetical protein